MKNKDDARILIVDDQIHALQGVSRIMRGAGYETFEASNGADCLKMAMEQKPDLILLDVILPDIDGLEVCKRIKSNPETKDIYVVLLSSVKTESESQADGLEQGADGYIAKPIANKELLARVKSILRLKYVEDQLRDMVAKYKTSTHDLEVHQTKLKLQNEEIKRTHVEMEESRDKFQELYDFTPVGYFTLNHKGIIKEGNLTGAKLLGTPRSKLIGRGFGHFLAPESEDQWLQCVLSVINQKENQNCELSLKREDGSTFFVHLELSSMAVSIGQQGDAKDGHMIRMTATDISERKRLDDALEQTNAFLNTLLNAIPVPIFYKDTDGRYTGFNKLYEEFFGKTHQELVGKSVFDIAPRDLAEIYHAKDLELFHNPGTQVYNSKVKDAFGAAHDVVFHKSTFSDSQGHILGLIGAILDITERKRLEDALLDSEERQRSLVEHLPQRIFIKDRNSIYMSCNGNYASDLGITPEQIVGKNDFAFYTPELAQAYRADDQACMATGMAKDLEEIYQLAGQERWIHTIKVPFHDNQGRVIGVLGIFEDITERRWIQEALRTSEERFRGMFSSHNAIMLLIEPLTGRIIDANKAAERFYGYTMSQLRSMFIQDINMMPPDEVERKRDLALQEHGNYFIFPHRLADGEVRTVEVHSSPIERNGELMLFSIIHDITDRILAESRLAEISELNQQIIANSPVGIAIYQEDGQCMVVNDAIGQIIGGTKEQALSQNFRQIKSWQDTGLIDMAMKTLNTGVPTSETIHVASSFGKTIWLSVRFNRFYLQNEPHLLLMFNDVTDVKETELKLVELSETLEERVAERSEELMAVNRQFLCEIREHAGTASSLKDSENRMTVAIESSPIGIFVIQDEKYTFSNQAFMKIFGLTNSLDLMGKQPETPYGDDSGKRFSDLVRQCVYRSEMINVNGFKVLTRDERERHLNIWLQPVEFWGLPAVMGFIIDVSEELELRSHLNQSQKMEALGSLASGIAHDFNNVLFAITGYSELALGSVPSGSPAKRQLEQVLAAAQRAANLVQHILTFSREREQEKQPILIGPILKESLSFLRASITQNIEIRRDISPDLHSVNADPTQIHQITMNLLTNAYHAMKNTGGVLDVTLEEVDLTTDFVKTRPGMLPGTYQRLMVSDTGHGMSPETLRRIFDPYFTTKEPGQGTGLGLSVTDAIVRDHGGTITVKSVPDSGTKFEVYFPIIMDKEISSEETEQAALLGNGRILFVDDETMLTDATKSNLEDFGYEVVAENDPVIALTKFEAKPYSFDLIITNMSMPNMTGLELSMKISKIRSDIPIILITGFSDFIAEKDLPDYGIRKLVYKPVRNAALAQTISKILTKQDLTGNNG